MKRVLVTGASGFIGRHCLPFLKDRGFEIYALSSKHPTEFIDGVHWIQADLLKPGAAQEQMASISPTHLLHLAWNNDPGTSLNSEQNLTWLKASLELLQAFVRAGGKRVVTAGTCAEFDWTAPIIGEQTRATPHSLYGSCKSALQVLTESYAKLNGISQAWGRVFYLFGPHESARRFVPAIINGLLKREAIPCTHGDQVRDFLHVSDVASAFVALLDSSVAGTVNIGKGSGVSLKQIAEMIAEKLGGSERIQFGTLQSTLLDPPELIADTHRLNEELNWSPAFTLEEGLSNTISWWESKHVD